MANKNNGLGLIVGVTGTQASATLRQKEALRQLFLWLQPAYLRHGDCIGVDAEAHDIYIETCIHRHMVLLHPPKDPSKRAFKNGCVIHEPLGYLERNRYIAGCITGYRTDILIVVPKEDKEQLRSGTWSTARYARKAGTPRIILLP